MTPKTQTQPSYAIYLWIWVGLIVLLAAGTFISYLPLSKKEIILLIFLVSLSKATLVALFYMHLKFEKAVPLWVVAIFPFFLIGLAAFLVLIGTALGY